MASRSTTVVVRNQTSAALARTSWDLAHGIWSNSQLPPEQISAGTPASPATATWESESQGFATGTEGTAVYTFPDNATTVTFYWDNPYYGSNGYRIFFTGPGAGSYKGSYSGGDGDNATVTFTVSPA